MYKSMRLLSVIALAWSGCGTPRSQILNEKQPLPALQLYTDEAQMRDEIQRYVRKGILTANRFVRDKGAEDLLKFRPGVPKQPHFVYSRRTPTSNWIASEEIQVLVFFANDQVTDIDAKVVRTCL
jgi:hypothetical protein